MLCGGDHRGSCKTFYSANLHVLVMKWARAKCASIFHHLEMVAFLVPGRSEEISNLQDANILQEGFSPAEKLPKPYGM